VHVLVFHPLLIIVLVLCVRCDRILTDMSVGLTNNGIY